MRDRRLEAIARERANWADRVSNAQSQIGVLRGRREEAEEERQTLAEAPEDIDLKRRELLSQVSSAEEDRKNLTDKVRQKIIAESGKEGEHGISGRDSIKIFNEFFSTYPKKEKLINMWDLCKFFTKIRGSVRNLIPKGFLESLLRMYESTSHSCIDSSIPFCNGQGSALENGG